MSKLSGVSRCLWQCPSRSDPGPSQAAGLPAAAQTQCHPTRMPDGADHGKRLSRQRRARARATVTVTQWQPESVNDSDRAALRPTRRSHRD